MVHGEFEGGREWDGRRGRVVWNLAAMGSWWGVGSGLWE